jgi:hypothetical protein
MYIKVQCPRDEPLIIGGGAEEQVEEVMVVMVVVVWRDPIAQFKILYHISHILLQITLCKRHREEEHWILTFGCLCGSFCFSICQLLLVKPFIMCRERKPKTSPQAYHPTTRLIYIKFKKNLNPITFRQRKKGKDCNAFQ